VKRKQIIVTKSIIQKQARYFPIQKTIGNINYTPIILEKRGARY
jgi:hypothetical protein